MLKIRFKNQKIKTLFISLILLLIFIISYSTVAIAYSNTYDIETHNCTHMTNEVHNLLSTLGVPSDIVYGHKNSPDDPQVIISAHCWLRIGGIDFECTTLKPKDNSNIYHVDYIEKDHKTINILEVILALEKTF